MEDDWANWASWNMLNCTFVNKLSYCSGKWKGGYCINSPQQEPAASNDYVHRVNICLNVLHSVRSSLSLSVMLQDVRTNFRNVDKNYSSQLQKAGKQLMLFQHFFFPAALQVFSCWHVIAKHDGCCSVVMRPKCWDETDFWATVGQRTISCKLSFLEKVISGV